MPLDRRAFLVGDTSGDGAENRNVPRTSWLLAGLGETVPGVTVNGLWASRMTAIAAASQMIAAGDANLVVAGEGECLADASESACVTIGKHACKHRVAPGVLLDQ